VQLETFGYGSQAQNQQKKKKLLRTVVFGYSVRMNTSSPMKLAIRAAGNGSRLARQLGVSHVSVVKWLKRGAPPAGRCLAIEEATGVSRYQLRPDIYGVEPAIEPHKKSGPALQGLSVTFEVNA
jgi:DNA-binding transcriptional regulator YdaS (Cro superfamily)